MQHVKQLDVCKCFTYVTKTIANLTTYSRKPGNYNGTIIFEIDIMKNSSPQFKIHIFCDCQNQNNTSSLLDSVSDMSWPFQIAYEVGFRPLCTVTFGKKVDFLNSNTC